MKIKKVLLSSLILLPLAAGLSACDMGKTDIGILQYGDFDALNNARLGFVQGLKDKGYGDLKIQYVNAHADASSNSTMAKNLASQNHKLNLAIATPCATALKAALDNSGKDTPLLFTATTDPVGAGLLSNVNAPEGFVTGSSDLQPEKAMEEQIKLVKKMLPTAKKIGFFYCSSETNSKSQADKAAPVAEKEGLEVITKTFTDQFSIKNEITALANDVQAIWLPTDNIVADNIGKIKEAIGTKKVLLIGGEEGLLTGAHVSISISYYDLGYKTAELAADVLSGKKISEIPVFYPTIETCKHVYNKSNLENAGFSVSDLPTEFTWSEVK